MFAILLRLLNIAFCAVVLFGPIYASAGLYPTLGYIADDGRDPTILYALPFATSAPAACERTTYKSYFCPATEYGNAWCSWRPQCFSGEAAAGLAASVCSYNPVSPRPRNAIDIIRYTSSTEPRQCSCPEGSEPDRLTGWCMPENAILSLSLFALTSTQPRPKGTGGTSTVELIAKVTEGANPKAGISVSFEPDVQPRSGGHDHDDVRRPKGTLNIAQGTTDANGEVKVTFTAPELAGIHTVKAICSTCSSTEVVKEIQVKVPDLIAISPETPRNADGTFVYALTSVDPIHAGNGRYHRNQYYLTQQALINLTQLISEFANAGWGTVALNDASLYWGGAYDITGNWGAPHSGHRDGREIDISFTRAQNPVASAKQKDVYKKFCETKGVNVSFSILHHFVLIPHFHVYLEKQKACNRTER